MAAYRGDEARLERRIEELEGQLSEARARLARLEGRTPRSGSVARTLLGADAAVSAGRTTPARLDDAAISALMAVLSRRYGVTGQSTRTDRGWTWMGASPSGRMADVQAVERGGRVRFVLRERLHGVMGGAFGGIVGGLGGGASFFAGLAAGAVGIPSGLGVAIWIALTALAARVVVARVARRRHAQIESIADDLVAALGARRAPGARIASSESEAAESEAAESEAAGSRAAGTRAAGTRAAGSRAAESKTAAGTAFPSVAPSSQEAERDALAEADAEAADGGRRSRSFP